MGFFSRKAKASPRKTVVVAPGVGGAREGTSGASVGRSGGPGMSPGAGNETGEGGPGSGGAAWKGGADEGAIRQIGERMLGLARGGGAGVWSARFYSDKLMNWSMGDPAFKVQLFRFVDAFPMLRTSEDVYSHLTDYLSQPGVKLPAGLDIGLKAGGVAKGLVSSGIGKNITSMAGKFIAGTDARSAMGNLRKLWEDGIAFSVDLLGEACVSEAEAEAYRDKYVDLIGNLPGEVGQWKGNERLERDHLGSIPRTNVSVKISSLSARCDPIDTEGSIRALMERLVPVLRLAKDKGVFVNFDMEQKSLKDLTIELFKRCCEEVDFVGGIALQAYLRSADEDARGLAAWAKKTGRRVTVRLVKGAYWDYEVINAEQQGWPCPVWPTKRETDACFERVSSILLDACPRSEREGGIKLALGSHNVRSIAAALAGVRARGLPESAIELQMLHGMADQLKEAAVKMGLRVREYVPVGEMIPGMAYLVRRLLENTSNESWLKAGFMDNADPAVLLASPHGAAGDGSKNGQAGGGSKADLYQVAAERHALSPAVEGLGDGRAFVNEPMRDFSRKDARDAFAEAVAKANVPRVLNDRTPEDGREMVGRAARAFEEWRDVDARVRAAVLLEAADRMRTRRDEFAGVMVKEAGKTWREADADVCEAIDFCEYYARLAVGMFERTRLGRFIGELDETWYQSRGVTVVISPWNFPLAICCGMTVAAMVTGNTVVVKPAEQTTGIASLMHDVLVESVIEVLASGRGGGGARPSAYGRGVLKAEDVVQLCPGPGETTGASLVRDPRVAVIAFTGSRDVGLDILHAASPPSPFEVKGGPGYAVPSHVKKVVCEMGGKNALIVDTSADLDEAVLAARHSAFGFQGQKCSACSRLIVVDPAGPEGPAIRRVIERLVEATKALVIGDATKPGTDVGPVIDAEAQEKILGAIEKGKRECRLELAMEVPAGLEEKTGRKYVGPHVFSGVTPEHWIAREEIFGPVLGVMHAGSFEEGLAIANGSVYKLTGGVFTRRPAHIEMAKRSFRVGNLYINRGITGALVARQPFGGFGMSGVGSKAGGVDYLLQFVEPRASCENMMRRGFAPEL